MEIRVGDTFEKSFGISADSISNFASATGDINPIHLDEEYAKGTNFGKCIAHGFYIASLISTVIGNDYPGNGTVYMAQSLKFLKPVFIGEVVKVQIEVTEINRNNYIKLRTACSSGSGRVIIGEATVIPPENCKLITA